MTRNIQKQRSLAGYEELARCSRVCPPHCTAQPQPLSACSTLPVTQ